MPVDFYKVGPPNDRRFDDLGLRALGHDQAGGANRQKTLLCDRNSICFTKLAFVFLVGGQTKRWISLCLSSSGVRPMLRRLFALTHRGLSGSIPAPFNLRKDDITRAWEVLTREIIINPDRTEASITVKHARYTGPNPESALAQTTATEADGLRLTVGGEVAGDQYASVELTMRTLSCEYFISSENEAWFLGKREQVSQLLRSLRPWYGWVRPFTLVLVSALSFVSAFFLVKSWRLEGWSFQTVLLGLSILVWNALGLCWRVGYLFPKARIILRVRRRMSKETLAVIIAAATLVATIV